MGTRVSSGRELTEADTAAAPLVALVNRTMADKYWAAQRLAADSSTTDHG
jgi:hypothetical protein